MSLKHKEYKEANERFLKENLTEEEVMELPCGVQYKILLRGNGPRANSQKYRKSTLPGDPH